MTAAVHPVSGELGKVIRGVRARWRARVALRGAVLVAAAALVILIVAAAVLEQQGFSERSLSVVRAVAYGVLAASAVVWMILPLLRRAGNGRIALYAEERASTLDAALVTAVEEASRGDDVSPFRELLVESAVKRARSALGAGGERIERGELARTSAALAAAIVCGVALVAFGPAEIGRTARLLLLPWGSAAMVDPYSIDVSPGDTTLARGADQEIVARLVGFDAPDVVLAVRRTGMGTGAAGDWERVAMALPPAGTDSARRTFRLFDLTQPTMYYVESGSVRSPVFTIGVADLPYVARIDHEYRYPAYTGLKPERVEDAGDIAALAGTRVRITATPTMPVARGRIIVEGEEPIPLVADSSGGGALAGIVSVRRQSFYRIELEASGGAMVRGSLDHTIDVLADEQPSVEITTPGRDTKVSPLEEAFVEAKATDDYGVRSLELAYSVNGAEERTIDLRGGSARSARETSAGHTFFLEELALKPGDVISYHARASDGNTASGPGRAASDIYFMEVRPFAREYRQAEQQGGGRGGDGGESPGALSARQREIVAATFKAFRDREQTGAAETRENLATLALAQGKLRERVELLQRRMRERGVLSADSSFATIAAELPAAAAAMRKAEELLAARDPRKALSPEQQALQHLLRAEAEFREVEVSFGGNEGSGGGGGESPNAEDLADLFELETDKLRNQYEAVERGSREQRDREVDEVMEKLKQLAARQQQENERMRQRAQSMTGRGGSGGASQRALAQEAEELARRLERLTRQNPEPELQESARRLREAANEMRRSATADGATGQRSGMSGGGRAALERLENARRRLGEGRDSQLDRDIQEALASAEALASSQREVAREAAALPATGADRDARQARLRDRKDRMAEQTAALEDRLDQIGREGARERAESAAAARDAARAIRDSRLRDKILYSKGLLGAGTEEYSRNFESGIAEDIDAVRDRVAEASRVASARPSRAREQTLQRARDLVQGLESLRERTAAAGQGAERGEGGAGGGVTGGASGGGGRIDPDRARQFRLEFRRQRLLADSIRSELRRQRVEVEDLDRLIERMRALESARIYDDRAELERLQASVLEGLKAYEFALRRELEGAERSRPLLGGTGEVPARFRALVEEYYRSLSRGTPP